MKRTLPFFYFHWFDRGSLVKRDYCGFDPWYRCWGFYGRAVLPPLEVLGAFFVSALKAVAPVLVFVLVAASIANQDTGKRRQN